MREDPPLCTPVTGPVRTLGYAQMRNSVGRLGHPETITLSEPVRPGRKRDPRPRVLGSRQTRSFLASTRGVRIPGFLDDAANQRAARVAEIGRRVAYWACVILFGSNRLAMTPPCRTTRHSAIERERACGTCYCSLVGTSFASAAR